MNGNLLHRPNAWIDTIHELAGTLEQVYANTRGEIWLYNNDLKVFKDSRAFDLLYRKMIDGSVATQVKAIKILLDVKNYAEFLRGDGIVAQNLSKLRRGRIRTFYLGCSKDVRPEIPSELSHSDPWIFYLGKKYLSSETGFVIHRPRRYPFADDDALENVALAWETAKDKLGDYQTRLASNKWFNEVFVNGVAKNFKSLEPRVSRNRTIGVRTISARSEEEIRSIHKVLKNKGPVPVARPVDVGILTTLADESAAVRREFNLKATASGAYEGRMEVGEQSISIVNMQLAQPGSVSGSIAASRLLHDWRPRIVFLAGRCGGWKEQSVRGKKAMKDEEDVVEGDVVVASEICAYEYQTVKKQNKSFRIEYDSRSIPVSSQLLNIASAIIGEHWEFCGDEYPKDWSRRKCKGIIGQYACGSKVVKVGTEWFQEIKKSVGKKKILATEMEGEGVGAVMMNEQPPVPFLLVKGISDFADRRKTDRYNPLSNRASANFIQTMLRRPELLEILQHRYELRRRRH